MAKTKKAKATRARRLKQQRFEGMEPGGHKDLDAGEANE